MIMNPAIIVRATFNEYECSNASGRKSSITVLKSTPIETLNSSRRDLLEIFFLRKNGETKTMEISDTNRTLIRVAITFIGGLDRCTI